MTDFYLTRSGRVFYESTIPAIVKGLERLNANLERIAAALEKRTAHLKEEPDETR